MHIAIIGAGFAGLAAARHALHANIGSVTVYEQSDQVGGMWVYTDQVGIDEFGLKIHSSIYHGLVTNAPKEIMAIPGIPFDGPDASYLPSNDVLLYLQRLARTFNLESSIRFRHQVTCVRPVPDTTKWTITARNLLADGVETSAVYDAVMVCNGHYSVPAFPHNVTGREQFRGQQMHSHDYRRAEALAGKSVLVIGSGPSGTDIAWLIREVVTKLAISVRGPNCAQVVSIFGPQVVRPDVRALSERHVIFVDETVEDFDVILYCTGYDYEFPFLAAECGIEASDCHVRPLFKQFIHMERPTMFFIGLTVGHGTLVMDTQVRVALRLLRNEWQLPPLAEMRRIASEDLQKCWDRGYRKREAHVIFDFIPEYLSDLTRLADLEPIAPVMFKIFDHAVNANMKNWKMFRNERFSIVDRETYTSEF